MESLQKTGQKIQGFYRKRVIENEQVNFSARLLLACLCFKQDETTFGIQQKASLEDWKAMVEIAGFHSVAQILFKRFSNRQISQEIPSEIQDSLRNIYLSSIRDGLRLSNQTSKILGAFQASGIPVIPLKGLYLVEKVYRNIALRPMGDIDLLVPYDQVFPALEQLANLGYRLTYPVDLQNDLVYLHSLPLLIDTTRHSIDLHWNLFPPEVPVQIDVASVWDHAYPDTLFDVSVLSMRCEELLLHLSLHSIYMHRYLSRFYHIVDLAMVLQEFKDQIEWSRVIRLAKEWGLAKACFLSLTLAEQLVDAPVPESVLRELQPEDYQPAYLENVIEQLLSNSNFSVNLAEFLAPSPIRQRIRFFIEKVFCPPYVLRECYPRLAKGIGWPFAYTLRLYDVLKKQLPAIFKLIQHDPEAENASRHAQKIEQLARWLVT